MRLIELQVLLGGGAATADTDTTADGSAAKALADASTAVIWMDTATAATVLAVVSHNGAADFTVD